MRHTTVIALSALVLAFAEAPALAADDASLFAGSIFQSLAAIIAFVLLLFILGKYAWGPILQGLQDREQKIKHDLEAAELANRKAQDTLAEYEEKLAEAHAEARRLLDDARGDADRLRQRLQRETEDEIARLRDRAKEEIGQARNQAVQDLYTEAAQLSIAAAEKILRRQIHEDDARSLVEASLHELEQTQPR